MRDIEAEQSDEFSNQIGVLIKLSENVHPQAQDNVSHIKRPICLQITAIYNGFTEDLFVAYMIDGIHVDRTYV